MERLGGARNPSDGLPIQANRLLPLVALLIAHSLFGERVEAQLARAREAIERLSPVVLTILTPGAGIVLVVRGANGLATG